ncbi:MAG TPA: methanogenesis marker 12 protein [Methanocella sp.]|uniref:methanogenesis marker 12 protein n=1 Tax=Methanocella sp. TaxID=2052833 RepID=UPI002C14E271|nr:methanogenesis marker 12 protein [Methanocella sp.]HTY90157.1 methanogenesis marker 12 protein [Methanocella sp.]
MFIGIDHGTTGIRFASTDGSWFELSRRQARDMSQERIVSTMLESLHTTKNDIELIALTYSMGDGISRITPIDKVENRGIISREGAGVHIGGGTNVYDAIASSGIPAVVIPGIHRHNYGHPCFRVYSHGASPEKLGIAYNAYMSAGDRDFIVSDISSNTVTMGVQGLKLLGAIDACIFAPGVHHGPLDLQAIRDVDDGLMTANDAFSTAGVTKLIPYKDLNALQAALEKNDQDALWAFDAIAVFAAMEVASFLMLIPDAIVFVAGSVGSMGLVVNRMSGLLKKDVIVLGKLSAAIGLAQIARGVHGGKKDILGITVE